MQGPADTRWDSGLRTTDPDGNVVVLTAGRPPAAADAAFSAQMRQWNQRQGLAPDGEPDASAAG